MKTTIKNAIIESVSINREDKDILADAAFKREKHWRCA